MNIGNLQNFDSETDGDEEWEGNELVFEGECDQCQITRPCILAVDPYIEEVYPDEYENLESQTWCKSCYLKRKDDI